MTKPKFDAAKRQASIMERLDGHVQWAERLTRGYVDKLADVYNKGEPLPTYITYTVETKDSMYVDEVLPILERKLAAALEDIPLYVTGVGLSDCSVSEHPTSILMSSIERFTYLLTAKVHERN